MTKTGKITHKQLVVLEALFVTDFDEQEVLKKYRVGKNIYNKWLADPVFAKAFNQRIDWLNRKSQALIARYATLAAAKLVQLTESSNPETAQRACLDIINMPASGQKDSNPKPAADKCEEKNTSKLSPETAGKILAALAEPQQQPPDNG